MRTTPVLHVPLRFVVLRHFDIPEHQDHFDILLEVSSGEDPEQVALMKYESTTDLDSQELKVAYRGNIRRRYLVYEGPMTRNRGIISRVDQGTFKFDGPLNLAFDGNMINGEYFFDIDSPCEYVRTIKDVDALVRKR